MDFVNKSFDNNKAYTLSGTSLNEIVAEFKKLGKVYGVAPITVTTGSFGTFVSLGDVSTSSSYHVKFQTTAAVTTYPTNDGSSTCKIFPAKIYPSITVDTSGACSASHTLETAGDEILVYNKYEQYIPVDTEAIVHYTSGLYWIEWARPFIKGRLDAALFANSDALMSVWRYSSGSESDSGENIRVYNWFSSGGSIAINSYVGAAFDLQSKRYVVTTGRC